MTNMTRNMNVSRRAMLLGVAGIALLIGGGTACKTADPGPNHPIPHSAPYPSDTVPAPSTSTQDDVGALKQEQDKLQDGEKRVTTPPEPKVFGISQGTYLVGTDMKAGSYRTMGPTESAVPMCYWARHKDASGTMDSIIANNLSEGPTTVTVNSGEYFETNGCHDWVKQ